MGTGSGGDGRPREPALTEVEGSRPSKARQPPVAGATFKSNGTTQELSQLAEAFDLASTISAEGAPFLRVLCARVGITLIAQWALPFTPACAPNTSSQTLSAAWRGFLFVPGNLLRRASEFRLTSILLYLLSRYLLLLYYTVYYVPPPLDLR